MIDLTRSPIPPHILSPIEARIAIAINSAADIVIARQHGRRLSLEAGSGSTEATLVATIISELARNVVLYAKSGEIFLEKTKAAKMNGIRIVCRDGGPGIADLHRALVGGYSTSGGLGMGLSGVRRLADEFDLNTGSGGTTVTVTKWLYDAHAAIAV
jgi:serine/threonine-protein kinase RsbT